jgi:hypothetical protein
LTTQKGRKEKEKEEFTEFSAGNNYLFLVLAFGLPSNR